METPLVTLLCWLISLPVQMPKIFAVFHWKVGLSADMQKNKRCAGTSQTGVWWKDGKVRATEGKEDRLSEDQADSWQEVTTLNHFRSTSHYTPNLPPTPFCIVSTALFYPAHCARLTALHLSVSSVSSRTVAALSSQRARVAFAALCSGPGREREKLALAHCWAAWNTSK